MFSPQSPVLIGAMIGRDAKQGETKEGLERKFDTPWHGP